MPFPRWLVNNFLGPFRSAGGGHVLPSAPRPAPCRHPWPALGWACLGLHSTFPPVLLLFAFCPPTSNTDDVVGLVAVDGASRGCSVAFSGTDLRSGVLDSRHHSGCYNLSVQFHGRPSDVVKLSIFNYKLKWVDRRVAAFRGALLRDDALKDSFRVARALGRCEKTTPPERRGVPWPGRACLQAIRFKTFYFVAACGAEPRSGGAGGGARAKDRRSVCAGGEGAAAWLPRLGPG